MQTSDKCLYWVHLILFVFHLVPAFLNSHQCNAIPPPQSSDSAESEWTEEACDQMVRVLWALRLNFKRKLNWVLLTSCKCHIMLSYKVHVQSASLQNCNIYYEPLLLYHVASCLADVSWWTQRKKTQGLHLSQPSAALLLYPVSLLWGKPVLLFLLSSDIVPDRTQTPLQTSACIWQSQFW